MFNFVNNGEKIHHDDDFRQQFATYVCESCEAKRVEAKCVPYKKTIKEQLGCPFVPAEKRPRSAGE